jgi:hypothetical protein
MLTARVDGELPGKIFPASRDHCGEFTWEADVVSPEPISRVEVLVNGQVKHGVTPEVVRTEQGAWKWSGQGVLSINDENRINGTIRDNDFKRSDGAIRDIESGWVVVRAWSDQPDGRKRFAHTGAWYFEVDQQPVRPPVQQIDYLLQQLDASIEKQRGVLPPEAMAEFEQAREVYRQIQLAAYADPVIQR